MIKNNIEYIKNLYSYKLYNKFVIINKNIIIYYNKNVNIIYKLSF